MRGAPPVRGSILDDERGSAIVAAVAFALIVGVIAVLAITRAAGVVSGSIGTMERAQARALAEHAVAVARTMLEDGSLAQLVAEGSAFSTTFPVSTDGWFDDAARPTSIEVTVEATHPRERIEVEALVSVGGAQHRATAVLRPRLSSDHVLLSEHASLDPALVGLQRSACAWGRADPRRDAGCFDHVVAPGTLEGPVHSNDAFALTSATIVTGTITTSFLRAGPDGSLRPALAGPDEAVDGGTSPAPRPEHGPILALPRDVTSVLAGEDVTCRFRGPTLLRFDGTRVRVTSPRSLPRVGEGAGGDGAIGCMGVDRSALGAPVTIDLPARAIIEVVADEDASCAIHPLGLPQGEDAGREWRCSAGDAFVWGRYLGARTVAAHDSIQVVWDLEPGDASAPQAATPADLMGLIAGDSVVLRRTLQAGRRGAVTNAAFAGPGIPPFGAFPLDAPTPTASAWGAPRIVAAAAALRGSVAVQNPFAGQLGTGRLSWEGSVATRFSPALHVVVRGPTGSVVAETGYVVDLAHDTRFDHDVPPAMPILWDARFRLMALEVG